MSICFWIVMAVVSVAAFLFVCVQVWDTVQNFV